MSQEQEEQEEQVTTTTYKLLDRDARGEKYRTGISTFLHNATEDHSLFVLLCDTTLNVRSRVILRRKKNFH